MATGLGSYFVAKFFRYVLVGATAVVLVFLPYQLLKLIGFGPLLSRAHDLVAGAGLPPFIGFLATVLVALVVMSVIGWLVMQLVRTQAQRIPLLRIFARTAERFDEAFRPDRKRTPTQVVLVAWPNENVRSVGMLMHRTTDEGAERQTATVYIPNTPNPLSGILRVVDVEKLEPTDWTVDDVMALAVSRGSLPPKGSAPIP